MINCPLLSVLCLANLPFDYFVSFRGDSPWRILTFIAVTRISPIEIDLKRSRRQRFSLLGTGIQTNARARFACSKT